MNKKNKLNLFKNPKRYLKYWYLYILRIPQTPHQVAMGLAIGVMAGHLPILPAQIFLALIISYLLKASKPASILGTWITNPLTTIPFHLLFYYFGRLILPFNMPPLNGSEINLNTLIALGGKFYLTLCVGAFIVGLPLALLSYFLAYEAILNYRKKREKIREKRKLKSNKTKKIKKVK